MLIEQPHGHFSYACRKGQCSVNDTKVFLIEKQL